MQESRNIVEITTPDVRTVWHANVLLTCERSNDDQRCLCPALDVRDKIDQFFLTMALE